MDNNYHKTICKFVSFKETLDRYFTIRQYVYLYVSRRHWTAISHTTLSICTFQGDTGPLFHTPHSLFVRFKETLDHYFTHHTLYLYVSRRHWTTISHTTLSICKFQGDTGPLFHTPHSLFVRFKETLDHYFTHHTLYLYVSRRHWTAISHTTLSICKFQGDNGPLFHTPHSLFVRFKETLDHYFTHHTLYLYVSRRHWTAISHTTLSICKFQGDTGPLFHTPHSLFVRFKETLDRYFTHHTLYL